MLKGIVLIATGHAGYGNMAYNLALTIKAVESIPVAVIYAGDGLGHLNDTQKQVFDYLIELPADYRTGFGVKLHLDQLTPFDCTLCLDVDMLWLRRLPSELMASVAGTGFTTITEGDSDKPNPKYYFWADPAEIKAVYGVNKIPQIRSEVVYFEKGTKVFKQARSVDVSPLKTIRMFGEHVPDELYFNIACAQLGIEFKPFNPAYWARLHGEVMPNLALLYREYYLLSFGSNAASPTMKRAYDNVMTVVTNKLRLPYMFKLKSKKEWAPGRLKI